MQIERTGAVSVAWADAGTDDPVRRRAAGDALLVRLVAELVPGAAVTIARVCPACRSRAHGRPVAIDAPVALSLSYAGSMVAAAAVRVEDAASVGIDIEPESRDVGDLGPLFAPHEPPDLVGWTRIEATLKADGRGIRFAPSDVVFDGDRATRPGPFDVVTIPGPEGFVVSIAVAASAPR